MQLRRLTARFGRPVPGRLLRRGHVPGLRTAKTTVAAVVAYVVADALNTSTHPVLAPLTALLVVQLTMYETIAHGFQRVGSVLAGVLVALAVAKFVGLTWWSLGAVVALSLVVGLVLRLGPQLLEVPISAMLVLSVGAAGAENVAVGRVYETFVGAAVGVFMNLVLVPPLYVRPAGEAIAELAGRIAGMLGGLAGELRGDWSRPAADHWLNESRALGADFQRADRSLERAEQSARLNPRAGPARQAQPRLRTALTGLEHTYVSTRNVCRAIFDRTWYLPPEQADEAFSRDARVALADVLDAAATAVGSVPPIAAGAATAGTVRMEIEQQLADLHDRRDRLSALLLVDPHTDQAAWQQYGALLAAVDRIRVEVEAAVRPSDTLWRPPIVTERQKQAIRKMMDAAAHAATEFQPFLPQPGFEDEPDGH